MEAQITDFFITHNSKDVLAYFTAKNCFNKKIEDAILAGIQTSFTYSIEMYQERTAWDSVLSRLEVRHTIKYDNVRKIFYVSFSEQGGVPVEFRNFESAKKAMVDVNGIAVAPLKILKRENQYFIRVKAKLSKLRVHSRLEYFLFFVSMWDFETEWYKQGFVYK
jgi:hypothetical protein